MVDDAHNVRCRERNGQRPPTRARPDRTANVATSSIRRRPPHLQHQAQRPGSLLSTHSGPRATAVCSSSAPVRDVTPSSWPGGLPGDRIGTSSRHRRGNLRLARGWPGPHGGAGVDMTCASLCYWATGCSLPPRPRLRGYRRHRGGDLLSRLVQVTMPVRQRQSCRPEPLSRRDRRGLDGGRCRCLQTPARKTPHGDTMPVGSEVSTWIDKSSVTRWSRQDRRSIDFWTPPRWPS